MEEISRSDFWLEVLFFILMRSNFIFCKTVKKMVKLQRLKFFSRTFVRLKWLYQYITIVHAKKKPYGRRPLFQLIPPGHSNNCFLAPFLSKNHHVTKAKIFNCSKDKNVLVFRDCQGHSREQKTIWSEATISVIWEWHGKKCQKTSFLMFFVFWWHISKIRQNNLWYDCSVFLKCFLSYFQRAPLPDIFH